MYSVYLLLGSNEGDRLHLLAAAREQIEVKAGHISSCSGIYETEAWGKQGLPPHLNQAVHVQTALAPVDLLSVLKQIEKGLGRKDTEKWGVRTMDIDIIYFEDFIISRPQLQIPHPLMQLRRFVLVPLTEIAPDYLHPVFLKTDKELLQALQDPLKVTLVAEGAPDTASER